MKDYRTINDLYDEIVTKMSKQGKRSYSVERGACMYRSPNGCRCAVGLILPDSVYHPHFEMYSINLLYSEGFETDYISQYAYMNPQPDRGSILILRDWIDGIAATINRDPSEVVSFLTCMQRVHDSASTIENLLEMLRSCRASYGITSEIESSLVWPKVWQ